MLVATFGQSECKSVCEEQESTDSVAGLTTNSATDSTTTTTTELLHTRALELPKAHKNVTFTGMM